jgi:hypothetical protein
MTEHRKPIAVGDMVHEFAQGFFGRDSYNCMQVVETGPDWILVQSAEGENERVEGFDRLIKFMELRDFQAREGCPYDQRNVNWNEDGWCHFKSAVQLTEGGPPLLPPKIPW